MGVLDVEVVIARDDVGDRYLPGPLRLCARRESIGLIAPPVNLGFKFLELHWLRLVVTLHALGVGMLVVPDVSGGMPLGEEQQVGFDTGVGTEHSIGQADDEIGRASCRERVWM